jgi:curli biogenesis system outer membrane secretion channel CsgG
MTRIVAALVALSVAAMAAAPTAAEAKTKKKRAQPYAAKAYAAPRNDGYHEFIAEKHPFGSQSWWHQMDREGRGGQSQVR